MAFETAIFDDCTEGLFYCIALWNNTVTDGYFWSIILMAFGIVIFMGTIGFGAKRAFGYATFSSAILSLILVQLSLIPLWFFTLMLVLAGVGLASMIIGER